jgi:hypothetical protein
MKCAPNYIHPKSFQDIFKSQKIFQVIEVAVYIKCIGACYQVPVQSSEAGDFVG